MKYIKKYNEKIDIDNLKYLYHATYKPLLSKIKKEGLGGISSKPNWEDSKNVVYLAKDPWVAESYAETTDSVPDNWLDEIIILKINIDDLNKNKLYYDRNVDEKDKSSFEYHGIIKKWEIYKKT